MSRKQNVAVAGMLLLGMAACQSAGTTPTGNTGPIVIGMPIALSGFVNFLDGPYQVGAQLAADDLNKQGGVNGRQIKIVAADTHSDASKAGDAALDVINQGAQFILPTVDYDFGGPAARVAEQHSLISMTLAGDVRFGKVGIGPHAFNIYSGTPTEAAVAVAFVKDQGWRHPYLLEDTSLSYSKDVCSDFAAFWQLGATTPLAGRDTFLNSDSSIASQITRLKSAATAPDAIILCSYPPGGGAAVKQLRAAGITTPIVGGIAFDGTFWLGAVPTENNMYVVSGGVITGGDPNAQRAKVFADFQAKTGKAPINGIWLLAGYSEVQAIAKGIQVAGSTDSKAVTAALEKFHNESLVIGPTTWTSSCHVSLGRPSVIIRMNNGKEEYVTTITPQNVTSPVC